MVHSVGIHYQLASAAGNRRGISLTEVILVVSIVSVLAAMILPAVQSARESARRIECTARLSQIGVALHGYNSVQKRLPPTFQLNGRHLRDESAHVHLLPWLDHSVLMDDVLSLVLHTPHTPMRGSIVNSANPSVLGTKIPVFRCPSETGRALNNYCYNQGSIVGINFDVSYEDSRSLIGLFHVSPQAPRSLEQVSDGMSNTAAFSERLSGGYELGKFDRRRDVWFSGLEQMILSYGPDPNHTEIAISICRQAPAHSPGQFTVYSGETWGYGNYEATWYNHVVTPNADVPNCSTLYPSVTDAPYMLSKRGIFRASSLHRQGVNCLLCDGSVRFISDQISTDLWRALGTSAGSESVSDF